MLPSSNVDKVLNVVFKFRIDGHEYQVYASMETLKCFNCNGFGHLKRFCPKTAFPTAEDTIVPSNTAPPVSTDDPVIVSENETSDPKDTEDSTSSVWYGFTTIPLLRKRKTDQNVLNPHKGKKVVLAE